VPVFIGFIAMFVPQVIILAGIVGRVQDASSPLWGGGDLVRQWNRASSIGGYIFAAGFPVFFANMALSYLRRQPTG
jgi:heme/copper-type cytochrome/quinol oxidase subunit 1